MIEDVLKNVREAEDKASAIIAAAEEEARKLRAAADLRVTEIIDGATKNAKAERANALTGATSEAERKAAEDAEKVRAECLKLKSDLDAEAENLSLEICRRIKDGDR